MKTAQERLFEMMGGREAYDRLRAANPELSDKLERIYSAEYEAAEEREVDPAEAFEVMMNPDIRPAKAGVIGGWSHDIEWHLEHDTEVEA